MRVRAQFVRIQFDHASVLAAPDLATAHLESVFL